MPETVRPVKVTTAAGAAVIDKDFAGLATPDDAVNLAFKLPGQVLDVPVAQGESVKKGALLAELDPRDIELQVSADRRLSRRPVRRCSVCSGCWSTKPYPARSSKAPRPVTHKSSPL